MQRTATPLSQASDSELARISAQTRSEFAEKAAGGLRERLLALGITGGGLAAIAAIYNKLTGKWNETSVSIATFAGLGLIAGFFEQGKKDELAKKADTGLAAEHLLRQRAEAKLAEVTALAEKATKAPEPSNDHSHAKAHADGHAPKHDAAHPHAAPEAHHDHTNKVHAAQHEGTVAGQHHGHDKGAEASV